MFFNGQMTDGRRLPEKKKKRRRTEEVGVGGMAAENHSKIEIKEIRTRTRLLSGNRVKMRLIGEMQLARNPSGCDCSGRP